MGITSDLGGPSEADREFVAPVSGGEQIEESNGQETDQIVLKIDQNIDFYNQEMASLEQSYMSMKSVDVNTEDVLSDSMRAVKESQSDLVTAMIAMREAGTLTPSNEAREARNRYEEVKARMVELIAQK